MVYSNFTLPLVKDTFDLTIIGSHFCESLPPAEPQPSMLDILNQCFPYAGIGRSEKAKSERLISPVLVEARRLAGGRTQIFSGEEFDVDEKHGLNGFCDFLFSRSDTEFIVDAPVIMLVGQPKEGILDDGWGPCVAQMVAAQTYNQNREQIIPIIYGCVTSGKLWQFLKLEGKILTIDANNYDLMPVQKILGILKWMLSE